MGVANKPILKIAINHLILYNDNFDYIIAVWNTKNRRLAV